MVIVMLPRMHVACDDPDNSYPYSPDSRRIRGIDEPPKPYCRIIYSHVPQIYASPASQKRLVTVLLELMIHA